MAGSVLEPKEILEYSAHKGTAKAENRADRLAVLGFLGGAFISVGYLAYVRIVAAMPTEPTSYRCCFSSTTSRKIMTKCCKRSIELSRLRGQVRI